MFDAVLSGILSGAPVLALHFIVTIAVFALAVSLYFAATAHHELALIRQGNVAASIAVMGVMLGLSLPLGICLAGSISVLDIAMWGIIALGIQLIAYLIVDRLIFKGISAQIEEDNIAAALFIAALKVSVGIINAAAFAV